ncbi:hypothetical protein [Ohtaekwangia sp.]|uniref:hypothetical protein n=1 Tax=Ohtaekwangia sp. TaxID=2066019 RepID=UPI002F93DB17
MKIDLDTIASHIREHARERELLAGMIQNLVREESIFIFPVGRKSHQLYFDKLKPFQYLQRIRLLYNNTSN